MLIQVTTNTSGGRTQNDMRNAFFLRRTNVRRRKKKSAEASAESTGAMNQPKTMGRTPLYGGKLPESRTAHFTPLLPSYTNANPMIPPTDKSHHTPIEFSDLDKVRHK